MTTYYLRAVPNGFGTDKEKGRLGGTPLYP